MYTNLDYMNADKALSLVKQGMDVQNAVNQSNANIQIVNIMIGNENIMTEDVFVNESQKLERYSICDSCDKNENDTCSECACPLPVITNMKFKECPLGKW